MSENTEFKLALDNWIDANGLRDKVVVE
jgi:hypothetical protein